MSFSEKEKKHKRKKKKKKKEETKKRETKKKEGHRKEVTLSRLAPAAPCSSLLCLPLPPTLALLLYFVSSSFDYVFGTILQPCIIV